jgi:hypothetical protein
MGADERRVAMRAASPYRRLVETAYPLLQDSGRVLLADGVRFHDLTAAFADHPESLYVDSCCHVSARGSILVADRIFEVISRDQ